MITCQDVLAWCEQFEAYLPWLDIEVLRRRYNGQTYKSTYAVGRAMGLSDETVRTIDNRALDALLHCRDLDENGQAITPMRLAKSFRQPVASAMCAGYGTVFTAATYTAHRGELIMFASSLGTKRQKKDFDETLPYGALIGWVLLVDCFRVPEPHPHIHKGLLAFAAPELFSDPIPYKGQPSYFYIDNAVAKQLPPRYAYRFKG